MLQRVDFIVPNQTQPDLFSDFLDDFSPHPITGDIARLKNEQSIKQSLRNLILTNLGERLFQPDIGSNVKYSLFEPNDTALINDLRYHIQITVQNNEPRVNLLQVNLTSAPDEYSVSIDIVFSIINSQVPQNLSLILRRVR